MNKKYFLLFSIFTLTAGISGLIRCASEELDAPSEQVQVMNQTIINRAFEYVQTSNVRELEKILASYPDIINIKNECLSTLLHSAAFFGKMDAARILIDNGANVNATNYDGKTALHLTGETTIVRLLLDNGAHVDAANLFGETALHMTVSSDHADAVKLLLERGANVNATSPRNEMYFRFRAKTALSCSISNRNLKIARLLLNYFPCVDQKQTVWLDQNIPNWRHERTAAFTAVREWLHQANISQAVVESIIIPMLGKEYLAADVVAAPQADVAQEAVIAPEEVAGMQEDVGQTIVAVQEQAAVVQGDVRVVPVQEIIIDVQEEVAGMQEDAAAQGPRQRETEASCCVIL